MPRKCYICGKKDEPQNMYVDNAMMKVVCNTIDCKAKYGIWKSKKLESQKPKSKRKAHPHLYRSELKKDLQDAINEIVRRIDKGECCICCNRTKANPCWDAGHRVSVGSSEALRYNLHNIFKQTRYCNSKSEGNKTAYDEGLEKMYGREYFDMVDSLRLKYKSAEIISSDLPGLVKEARKIARELKSLDLEYSPDQRIRLREEYNKRIGVY